MELLLILRQVMPYKEKQKSRETVRNSSVPKAGTLYLAIKRLNTGGEANEKKAFCETAAKWSKPGIYYLKSNRAPKK